MVNNFPELPYEYDSLEPYIDKETMQIHHDKHHKAYFDKFVVAIRDSPELQKNPVEKILSNINKIPEKIRQAVINNGGGFYNHNFFWSILKKNIPFNTDSKIGQKIVDEFGSFDNFKEQFSNSALTLFGSGWTWLVIDKKTKKLEIMQTKNQDSPISVGKIPLITIDVWEHAYYLKYQNKRVEYIQNFFNVIDWKKVEKLFLETER
jgi:Fe-Mn family superoxide dismutase